MASLPERGVWLKEIVSDLQKDYIKQALDRCNWNKSESAKLLGLQRSTLVEMMRRHGFKLLPMNKPKKFNQTGE